MKKTTFFTQKLQNLSSIAVFLLVLAGIVCSCKPDPEPEPTPNPKDEEEIEYPIDISFTEYSLDGTSCQWVNLNYNDELIIINSDEELQDYIECTNGTYPQINFSRHSLLCASGIAPSAPAEVISTRLLQTSDNEYSLHLIIESGMLATQGPWILSIIAPKLPQNAIVTLTTIYKPIWKENI